MTTRIWVHLSETLSPTFSYWLYNQAELSATKWDIDDMKIVDRTVDGSVMWLEVTFVEKDKSSDKK